MVKNGLKMVSETGTGTKYLSLFFYIQIWSPVGVGAFLSKTVFIFLMHIIKTHVQKRSQDGLQNRYKIFELVFQIWSPVGVDTFCCTNVIYFLTLGLKQTVKQIKTMMTKGRLENLF